MRLTDDMIQLAGLLSTATRVVVFTGAGVSKESGLDTFRDAGGVWQAIDPEEYASPAGFRRQPREVWRWYQARRRKMQAAAPNPAHYAIAELEELFPHVVIITQNIDGLHQKAGSSRVLELHGSLRRYKCAVNCRGAPTCVPLPPLDAEEPVRCPHCDAYTRPDIVWFHEMLPFSVWEEAVQEAVSCDAILVVGTSGVVEPAASLPREARTAGAYLLEVNLEPTALTHRSHVSVQGRAGVVLPLVVNQIRAYQQQGA